MTISEVLRLVISRLESLGIPYMVSGSFASAAHGVPISSVDADVIVDVKLPQAEKLAEAFKGDFYVDLGQVRQAIVPNTSFNIVHLDSMYKIDLFALGRTVQEGLLDLAYLQIWAEELKVSDLFGKALSDVGASSAP